MKTRHHQHRLLRHREPLWPVLMAFMLLVASGAGLVLTIAAGPEQSAVWYTEPWFWLGSLALLTLGLTVALFRTRRRLRRRMQTALVVSLIVHLLLAIYLKDQVLALVLSEQDQLQAPRVEPVPTMPNYYLPAPGMSREAQPFERPTEANFEGQLSQLNRQRPLQSLHAEQSPSNTESPAAALPNEQLQRRSMSSPREARQLSLRSRQLNQLAESHDNPITPPPSPQISQPTRQRDSASDLTPAATANSRRQQSNSSNVSQPNSPMRRSELRASDASRLRPTQQSIDREVNSTSMAGAGTPSKEGVAAKLVDAMADSDLPSRTFESPSNSSAVPSTSSVARQATRHTETGETSWRAATRPTAAVTGGSITRPQRAEDVDSSLAMALPSRSLTAGRLRETSVSDAPASSPAASSEGRSRAAIEPSTHAVVRPTSQGIASVSPPSSASRSAADPSVTRGRAASGTLPRVTQQPVSEDVGSRSSRQPLRRIESASTNDTFIETANLVPSDRSPAPAEADGQSNLAAERRLARRATGPMGRSRSASTENRNDGEVSRADMGVPLASRVQTPFSSHRSEAISEGSGTFDGQTARPGRRQLVAQIGEGDARAESPATTNSGRANGQTERHTASPTSSGQLWRQDTGGVVAGQAAVPSSNSLSRTQVALPTQVTAPAGAGGLGDVLANSAGILDRRASPRSDFAHEVPQRLLAAHAGRPRSGQLAELGSQSRRAAAPFAGRIARNRSMNSQHTRDAPSAQTEQTVERGLTYLARVQHEDGRWSLQQGSDPAEATPLLRADTAATGLALLAFLGAGYDHFDGKYQKEVSAGLQWLLGRQRDDGDLFNHQAGPVNQGIWLYSHGIAAIALCEAYGMTGDEQLKLHAQKGLDFIVTAQHPTLGGWRYAPGGVPDLSVSGWQLMALRSGQLAGLNVPSESIDRVRGLLQRTSAGDARFVYNPWSREQSRALVDRSPTSVMTSVGLLMRLYSGSDRTDPQIQQGALLLSERLPNTTASNPTRSMQNPNRDAYYWYNATQVMFHMQGERWANWRDALFPLLSQSQEIDGNLAGSWDPFQPAPDRWAQHAGRLYVTTMNLLSLEVYYRHLPLYDDGLGTVSE